jgi:hypothetical protein
LFDELFHSKTKNKKYHSNIRSRLFQFLVFCVMFCRSFFVLLSFFFRSLYCLSFFHLRLLINPSDRSLLIHQSSFGIPWHMTCTVTIYSQTVLRGHIWDKEKVTRNHDWCHMWSSRLFQFLVFCVMFCRSFFVLLSFFFRSLYWRLSSY